MKNFAAFILEFIKRFGLESPKFFKVLAAIGMLCTFIGYIPQILNVLEITPTEVFSHYLQILLKVAGLTTTLVSFLTVNNAGAIAENTDKLKYTAEQKAIGNDKPVSATIANIQSKN